MYFRFKKEGAQMLKYLKKYSLFAVLAPLFMIGEVSMDLIQPGLMSRIIDDGVLGLSSSQNSGSQQIIITVGLQMIGVVILGGIFGILSGVFVNLCSQNFGNDLRKDCFRKIMSLSLEQTDHFSTGSLITRVTNDVTQVQNMVSQLIRGCVRTGMIFVGGIYCMLTLNLSFGIIVLCALPFVLTSVIFFISKANPSFKALQKNLDHVNNVMQENVSGARVVKAYIREDYEQKRFKKANDDLVNVQLRVLKLFAYMTPITNIVLNIALVIVIRVGAIKVQAGDATPGKVMAAITYMSLIMHAVMMIAMIFQTISRGLASTKRLNEVLVCSPTILDGHHAADYKKASDCNTIIEFKDVSFKYPDSPDEMVLKHINLSINRGETVAILGGTGCGKTSLAQLLIRFYDATEGLVLIDGVPVKEYELKELRNKVSIALQKSELYTTTIGDNIRLGRKDASMGEIETAAEMAQAMEFINEKPEHFDTEVAERGTSLSGGQKQRVAIARALLKNSDILIFDDSTSALDLKTEANINKALQTKYKDITKVIIAQRIASVMRADRIVVMDKGKIIACAPHEELMKNCEIYKDIYYSQLRPGGEADAI